MSRIIIINNKIYYINRLPIESNEMFYDRVSFISKHKDFNINIINKSKKYMYEKYFNLKY